MQIVLCLNLIEKSWRSLNVKTLHHIIVVQIILHQFFGLIDLIERHLLQGFGNGFILCGLVEKVQVSHTVLQGLVDILNLKRIGLDLIWIERVEKSIDLNQVIAIKILFDKTGKLNSD